MFHWNILLVYVIDKQCDFLLIKNKADLIRTLLMKSPPDHICKHTKINVKMFQIHQKIFCEYSWNLQGLPTYGFAYTKIKKSIFNPKIESS